jgi:hypothetical protein
VGAESDKHIVEWRSDTQLAAVRLRCGEDIFMAKLHPNT